MKLKNKTNHCYSNFTRNLHCKPVFQKPECIHHRLIINAALILTTVYAGLACGIILSVITQSLPFSSPEARLWQPFLQCSHVL